MNHFISGDTMRFLSVLSLFILPCLVLANDGFGALGAGGIIIGKTDDIAMAKEVLDISYDKIKVDYEFVNESDHDITETIVFPLPPYLVGDPNPAYIGTIPDFKVVVNGKSVQFKTKVRAVSYNHTETDITQKLKGMGFNDYDIVMADYNLKKILQDKSDILKKNGLLDPNFVYTEDFGIEPLWKNYVTYEWKQTFKAHQKLKVSHTYTPLSGGAVGVCYDNYLSDGYLISSRKDIEKRYCVDSKSLDKLDNLAKNPQNYKDYPYPCLKAFDVSYILRTANTWKDGIRDFKLIVRKRKADEIISLCFPGDFKKTTSLTYEVELKNFKPKQDLSIYFGNADKNAPFQPEAKPPIFH